VSEVVHVAGAEDEAAAQLKRILSEFVLAMAGRLRSFPAPRVVAAKQMEQIGGAKLYCTIRLALFVNQQRKCNPRYFAEDARVVAIAHSDGRERSSFGAKLRLVLAQLRDMLAAKDSPVMAEKHHHHRRRGPERPEPLLAAVAIRQRDAA
jgi:hypothetical protein